MFVDKGVAVLPTLDRVWHRESNYWRKYIRGVHNIQILIRDLLKELLRKFSAESSGGGASGALLPRYEKINQTT